MTARQVPSARPGVCKSPTVPYDQSDQAGKNICTPSPGRKTGSVSTAARDRPPLELTPHRPSRSYTAGPLYRTRLCTPSLHRGHEIARCPIRERPHRGAVRGEVYLRREHTGHGLQRALNPANAGGAMHPADLQPHHPGLRRIARPVERPRDRIGRSLPLDARALRRPKVHSTRYTPGTGRKRLLCAAPRSPRQDSPSISKRQCRLGSPMSWQVACHAWHLCLPAADVPAAPGSRPDLAAPSSVSVAKTCLVCRSHGGPSKTDADMSADMFGLPQHAGSNDERRPPMTGLLPLGTSNLRVWPCRRHARGRGQLPIAAWAASHLTIFRRPSTKSFAWTRQPGVACGIVAPPG